MSKTPTDRHFAKTHEWALKSDRLIIVGITQHAVRELGDLVFIDLPEVGASVTAGQPFGEIESVKAVGELNAPVTGNITEINSDLEDSLDTVVESPYEDGWMIKVEPTDPAEYKELMDQKAYDKHISEAE